MKRTMKKLSKFLLVLALGITIWLPGVALANIVITFDDLSTPNSGSNISNWGVVPSSYWGFTWTGFAVTENSSFKSVYGNTGDFPSLPNAVFNNYGSQTVTIDFGVVVNVIDAYFRSWSYLNGPWAASAATLTLNGYNGNTLLDTLTVPLSYTGMVDTPINFLGVTRVDFVSDAPGHYWLMDNLQIPLPPTALLLGSGLVGLVLLRFRKRFKA
jgi:hypothetical protein